MTKQKLLVWYIFSVLAVSLILIALRWQNANSFWEYMDLISTCIWQAVVWPLYLLVNLAAGSK